MVHHLLILIALMTFSIATHAAAIPMDAGQAARDATQNADFHQEVARVQGGDADKEVADSYQPVVQPQCAEAGVCTGVGIAKAPLKSIATFNDLLALDGESSAASALIAMLIIVGSLMFYSFRRASSMK
jgi:hypothetical protein